MTCATNHFTGLRGPPNSVMYAPVWMSRTDNPATFNAQQVPALASSTLVYHSSMSLTTN